MGFDPSRPFTVATAAANGITARQLEGPAYQRLFHAVHIAADATVTPAVRARAALIHFPGKAYLSHVSAARSYGAPVPAIADEHVTVWSRQDRRRRRGIVCHVGQVTAQLMDIEGMRMSGPDQMFAELATLIGLVDLVVVGDWLVGKDLTTPQRLVEFCTARRGPGAALARRAAAYVRERVDSPMETRLRMLIVLAGLPEPRVNLTLRSDVGEPIRRHDLCYPAQKIAIEYNGRVHLSAEQAEADSQRREDSDDEGWRTIVVFSNGIYVEPQRTLDRIWRVARDRRVPRVPARLSEEWRPHFPGRG